MRSLSRLRGKFRERREPLYSMARRKRAQFPPFSCSSILLQFSLFVVAFRSPSERRLVTSPLAE